MALIPCRDCGRGISPNAASCPHCGRPLRRKWPVGTLIRLIFAAAALILLYRVVLLPTLQHFLQMMSSSPNR